MPVNSRQAAPVDVILSKYSRGYRNSEMISHRLFPRVPIPNRYMKTIAFGKESFRLLNTRRSPGSKKKRIQYGFSTDPVSLYQEALEGVVAEEHQQEAEKVPNVNLGQGAIKTVMDVEDLNLEVEAANLALDADNYDPGSVEALLGSDKWSHADSNPLKVINDARATVRRRIGRKPNTLVLPSDGFDALCDNPKIRDQFKYVSKDSISEEMLARYFKVKQVIVGDGVYLPETAGDDDEALDIWGNSAVLAYVPLDGATYNEPSFAYTYELMGMPEVRTPYWDNTVDSWIYPVKLERRPKIVGADAGFLIKDIL